ncbi:hypothetical protein M2244_003730 [Rhodoferax antarcticus]|nr:hypothetical protein [Rhodoferax antarcticus]
MSLNDYANLKNNDLKIGLSSVQLQMKLSNGRNVRSIIKRP